MPVSRITARATIEPYWSMPEAKLYLGDVRKCLRMLPARSIQCMATSPPYWGLRDYGVCICAGNNPDCHLCKGAGRTIGKEVQIGTEPSPDCGTGGQAQCGACFVCNMVSVFRELKRVMRDDGVAWLNLGDTYSSSTYKGLPSGNLIGVPWRVALALQADGWILRQDVIWSKPDPMPESVTNRCSKSHEYIFMLTRSEEYYFDQLAIARTGLTTKHTKTTLNSSSCRQQFGLTGKVPTGGNGVPGKVWTTGGTGNEYSVWRISTGSSKVETHFATFSKEVVRPCILSSTSEHGCCAMCHKPWERVVVKTGGSPETSTQPIRDRSIGRNRNGVGGYLDGVHPTRETVGWKKACACRTDDVVPCTVLDPFVGSGTTVVTAIDHGRYGVGIDVCQAYLDEHAIPRIRACIVGGSGMKKKPTSAIRRGSAPDMGEVFGI